jgi:paraquat-inducible protein B
MIHLQAPDLGSLNSGSLVYFRKIPVGRVYDYAQSEQSGRHHRCADRAPLHQPGEKGSRFWNVSGVKADVGLSGAKVQLESLSALVNGAIAFDSPADSHRSAKR